MFLFGIRGVVAERPEAGAVKARLALVFTDVVIATSIVVVIGNRPVR